MKASVESMGGTTLEIIIPSTVAISRPAGEKRLCSRMPHSSAVCSWTVRSRHWQTSLRPSNAPIVMLLLPASRASSTYASRKNQGNGSIVFAHYQKTGGVKPGRSSDNRAAGLLDGHAPARGIAGCMREETQDGLRIVGDELVYGREEFEEDVFACEFAAGVKPQRGCFERQLARKYRMVDVDA